MKECSKCKQVKPYEAFHKNASNKDGYNFQCKECRKEGCASYFASLSKEDKEVRNESKRLWAAKNKDHVLDYAKAYASVNKARRTATQRKRELAKKQRTPSWLSEQDLLHILCLYQVAAMRNRETDIAWHVDHIVPIQGKNVCGLHVPWNLQVIPALENNRKYNKYE